MEYGDQTEETYRQAEYENTSRVMERWATRGRKTRLQGASDEKSDPVTDDPDRATSAFITDWKQLTEETSVDLKKAKAFLKQHMRKLPEFNIVSKLAAFAEISRKLSDSAYGPDGVPYSAWRHASDQGWHVLHRLSCSLFTSSRLRKTLIMPG